MNILIIVYHIEYLEDLQRFENCLMSIPPGFFIVCTGWSALPLLRPNKSHSWFPQLSNYGKSTLVNNILDLIDYEYVCISDGDMLFPGTFLDNYQEMIKYLSIVPIVACDQTEDRRHSTNVPTNGDFHIMRGIAGGIIVCSNKIRYPVLGSGYQQEDVALSSVYTIGICPDVKVCHPFVKSNELIARQKCRLFRIMRKHALDVTMRKRILKQYFNTFSS